MMAEEAMADTGSPQQEPRLIRTLRKDVPAVWEEIRRVGVRRTFSRSFADLQEFYLTTHRRDRLAGMGLVKRTLYLGLWLLKALFLKLTPARRLLLLLSFWLMWQGRIQIDAGSTRFTLGFPLLAMAVLLLILMFELKDKLLARSELEAGRAVQLALMPNRAPSLPGWDIWLFTRSANDVGGADGEAAGNASRAGVGVRIARRARQAGQPHRESRWASQQVCHARLRGARARFRPRSARQRGAHAAAPAQVTIGRGVAARIDRAGDRP
jgi:hypothetical protein